MADTRSRVEKLMAMATQDASPAERDTARAILATMGAWPPPPRPPAPPAAPAPEPDGTGYSRAWAFTGTNASGSFMYGRTSIRRPENMHVSFNAGGTRIRVSFDGGQTWHESRK